MTKENIVIEEEGSNEVTRQGGFAFLFAKINFHAFRGSSEVDRTIEGSKVTFTSFGKLCK
jgi:hypothetical protein